MATGLSNESVFILTDKALDTFITLEETILPRCLVTQVNLPHS